MKYSIAVATVALLSFAPPNLISQESPPAFKLTFPFAFPREHAMVLAFPRHQLVAYQVPPAEQQPSRTFSYVLPPRSSGDWVVYLDGGTFSFSDWYTVIDLTKDNRQASALPNSFVLLEVKMPAAFFSSEWAQGRDWNVRVFRAKEGGYDPHFVCNRQIPPKAFQTRLLIPFVMPGTYLVIVQDHDGRDTAFGRTITIKESDTAELNSYGDFARVEKLIPAYKIELGADDLWHGLVVPTSLMLNSLVASIARLDGQGAVRSINVLNRWSGK